MDGNEISLIFFANSCPRVQVGVRMDRILTLDPNFPRPLPNPNFALRNDGFLG